MSVSTRQFVVVFSGEKSDFVVLWVSGCDVKREERRCRLVTPHIDGHRIDLGKQGVVVAFNHGTRGLLGEDARESHVQSDKANVLAEVILVPHIRIVIICKVEPHVLEDLFVEEAVQVEGLVDIEDGGGSGQDKFRLLEEEV